MKKAMIVYDFSYMRFSLKKRLNDCGVEVLGEASNKIDAIKLYAEIKPDIVVIDITVPGLNGIETLQMIRSVDISARIIVISAINGKNLGCQAIMAGAIAFIQKPFNKESITLNILEQH